MILIMKYGLETLIIVQNTCCYTYISYGINKFAKPPMSLWVCLMGLCYRYDVLNYRKKICVQIPESDVYLSQL